MAGARERLEAMLLEGANLLERRAAMQALTFWPPANLKLRVVELGICRTQTETILHSHGIGKTYFLLEDEELPAEKCWTDLKHYPLVCRITSRITTNRPAVLRWNLGNYRAMHAPSLVPLAETRLLDSPTDCILVTSEPPASAVLLPPAGPNVPARDRLRASAASWISNGEYCSAFVSIFGTRSRAHVMNPTPNLPDFEIAKLVDAGILKPVVETVLPLS